jgi:hypothetical protein
MFQLMMRQKTNEMSPNGTAVDLKIMIAKAHIEKYSMKDL